MTHIDDRIRAALEAEDRELYDQLDSDMKVHEMLLGPFQGTVACTRIQKGKGVCGTSWRDKKAIIVPDVDKFPGHII